MVSCGVVAMGSKIRFRSVTLIEAVLFISIAIGVIIGGLVFFRQAQTASRTMETVRLYQALLTESKVIIRSGPPVTATTFYELHPILVASGAVPPSVVNGSGQIVVPWGGQVLLDMWLILDRPLIVFAPSFPVPGQPFTPFPSEICTRIIVTDENGIGPLGHEIVAVGAGSLQMPSIPNIWTVDPTLPSGGLGQGPIRPSDAAYICETIMWHPNARIWFDAYQ
jgi:hypothetical protein